MNVRVAKSGGFCSGVQKAVDTLRIPAPLQGLGVAFIVTGLMGISFMCFLGMEL